jgi:hypothetical protein
LVNINTEELVKILDNDPSVLLIDVRAPFEIKHTGTIKRGQNVNIIRGWIETQIADYAKTTIGFSTTGVALLLKLENQSPKEALALVKIKIMVIIIK